MSPGAELRSLIISLALFLILPAGAESPSDGGTNAAEFLRLGAGARAPGLGDAMTASASRTLALHYNPAGLSGGTEAEVSMMYQSHILNINQGEMAFSYPLSKNSGWGIEFAGIDYGVITRTTLSNSGAFVIGNTAGKFSAREWTAGIGYGRTIEEWAWGATGRVISSTLDNATAYAAALDAGIQWRPGNWPVEMGAAVRNAGTGLTFDRVSAPLPLLVRGGAALSLFENRLKIFADVEKAQGEDFSLMTGGEATLFQLLNARIGYDGRRTLGGGLTAGLGVHTNNLAIDYAWQPWGAFGNGHRIGLGYRFDPKPGRVKEEPSRPLPRPKEALSPAQPPSGALLYDDASDSTELDIRKPAYEVKGTWKE